MTNEKKYFNFPLKNEELSKFKEIKQKLEKIFGTVSDSAVFRYLITNTNLNEIKQKN